MTGVNLTIRMMRSSLLLALAGFLFLNHTPIVAEDLLLTPTTVKKKKVTAVITDIAMQSLIIKKKTKVRFLNKSRSPHTATQAEVDPVTGEASFVSKGFDTGIIPGGEKSKKIKFDKVGEFIYKSRLPDDEELEGSITVVKTFKVKKKDRPTPPPSLEEVVGEQRGTVALTTARARFVGRYFCDDDDDGGSDPTTPGISGTLVNPSTGGNDPTATLVNPSTGGNDPTATLVNPSEVGDDPTGGTLVNPTRDDVTREPRQGKRVLTTHFDMEADGMLKGSISGELKEVGEDGPTDSTARTRDPVQLMGILNFEGTIGEDGTTVRKLKIYIDSEQSVPGRDFVGTARLESCDEDEDESLRSIVGTGRFSGMPTGSPSSTRGSSSIPGIAQLTFGWFTPLFNVQVFMEPREGSKMLYLPVAPYDNSGNYDPMSLIILKPIIRNLNGFSVTLQRIEVSFIGPPAVSKITIFKTLVISAGQRTESVITSRDDNILVPFPPPPTIKIDFFFFGYSSAVTRYHSLARHTNPKPEQSYRFPGNYGDLARGEYWSTATGHRGLDQRFGYDMGLVRWNGDKWTGLHPNRSGDSNSDYLIWNHRVYAMADGVVVECTDGIDDNPNPPDKINGGGGNHFWIRHKNDFCLYAHFKKNTINGALCSEGAVIDEGDFLGRVGNSGSSTAAHLHIHCMGSTGGALAGNIFANAGGGRRLRKSKKLGRLLMPFGCSDSNLGDCNLRPLAFRNAKVVRRQDVPDPTNPLTAKWVQMDGGGPPHRQRNLILPGSCGNGLRDPGEECDGNQFGGKTCRDFGSFTMGSLICDRSCRILSSGCSGGTSNKAPGSYADCGYTSEDCDNDPSKCDASGDCLGGPCRQTDPSDFSSALIDPFNHQGEFHPDGDFKDAQGNLYYCQDYTNAGEMVCRDVNGWGVCHRCASFGVGDYLRTRLGCQCNFDDDCFSTSNNDPVNGMGCYGEDFGAGPGFCWDSQDGPPQFQCVQGACGQAPWYKEDQMYCEHYPDGGGQARCEPWYACNPILAKVCAASDRICMQGNPGCTAASCCEGECLLDEHCSGDGWPNSGYQCSVDGKCVP